MKIFIFVLSLIGLDQLTKYLVREAIAPPFSWDPYLAIELSHNTGIAFSMPLPIAVIIPLTLVVIGWLIWTLWHKSQPYILSLALSFILAGAVGNLLDRVFLGAVTDFIAVWRFPIFNLADTFISLGVLLYFWHEVIGGEH